jgi:hypothetical protein
LKNINLNAQVYQLRQAKTIFMDMELMSLSIKPAVQYRLEPDYLARQMGSAWLQAGRVNPVVHQRDQEDYCASPTEK